MSENPRYFRALDSLKLALVEVESARDNLGQGHPDYDLADDVHADLRYAVL